MTSHPTDRTVQELLRWRAQNDCIHCDQHSAGDESLLEQAANRIDALERALADAGRIIVRRGMALDKIANGPSQGFNPCEAQDIARSALHPSDDEEAQAGSMK